MVINMDTPSGHSFPSCSSHKFGEPLDYESLKSELYSYHNGLGLKYKTGNPFTSASIDLSHPMDKVRIGDNWYVSGYVVERVCASGEKVFSQIVQIFPGLRGEYYAALLDLEKINGRSSDEFDENSYTVKGRNEELHEVRSLKAVSGTPKRKCFFDPRNLRLDSEFNVALKEHSTIAEEENQANNEVVLLDGLNYNLYP